MLKLTTDKHEASRCLSATAELLVFNKFVQVLSVADFTAFAANILRIYNINK